MTRRAPITAAADRARSLPGAAADRLDRIGAALASLADEQRRLERLGLEPALVRCRDERRYWEFLAALHRVAADEPNPATGSSW